MRRAGLALARALLGATGCSHNDPPESRPSTTARCGVASVRKSDDFTGYVIVVVGPDAIPGCTRGAPVEFRINGKPASRTTAVNTPPGREDSLALVQQ